MISLSFIFFHSWKKGEVLVEFASACRPYKLKLNEIL